MWFVAKYFLSTYEMLRNNEICSKECYQMELHVTMAQPISLWQNAEKSYFTEKEIDGVLTYLLV